MTEKTVKIKKESIHKSIIVILALALLISIFTGGFGTASKNEEIKQNAEPEKELNGINMKSLIDDDAIKGDKNAPITIVEFSDYECPYCAKFYSETFNQIKSEYIDTGKVNFVYRDFPLNFHKNAQKAAEAAECAGEQDQYYDMHDKLFEKGVTGGVDSFKEYAIEIGLNEEQFNNCLDSGEMSREVKQDLSDGQKAGVRGTPAFFIEGEMISGAQPFSVFKQKIDSYL